MPKTFKCSIPDCSFKSMYLLSLQRHEKYRHGEENKKIGCPYPNCNFRASDSYQLKRHSTVHADEKQFSCSFPGCKFKSRWHDSLVRHNRIHLAAQEPSNRTKFQCTVCSREFQYQVSLDRHKREHLTTKKTYSCSTSGCSFSAWDLHRLKRHQYQKPVPCRTPGCNFLGRCPFDVANHSVLHGGGGAKKTNNNNNSVNENVSVKKNDLVLSFPDCNFNTWETESFQSHRRIP